MQKYLFSPRSTLKRQQAMFDAPSLGIFCGFLFEVFFSSLCLSLEHKSAEAIWHLENNLEDLPISGVFRA